MPRVYIGKPLVSNIHILREIFQSLVYLAPQFGQQTIR